VPRVSRAYCRAALTDHVDDPDAVESEWSAKTIDEVLPVTLETLTELRRSLESKEE
jgi:hypothetical protein